jgi:putative glycosyltransferase (TIGR04348 family)
VRILLVTPAPPGSRKGNRITALRWAALLRSLGHQVTVRERFDGGDADLLIALHARKSFDSVHRFREAHPRNAIIVALTGTDLYGDLRTSAEARRTLDWATRIVVLQPLAARELPPDLRPKVHTIFQSVPPSVRRPKPVNRWFDVCVLGHLRPVKDPFRTAEAVRRLPAASRIRILHVGGALTASMRRRARQLEASDPRYRWLGEVPRWKALRILSRSRLLVLSSRMEGGANVIGEAITHSVPILASRIAGSVGLLGDRYPGYFPVGDTRALAALLHRAETDRDFLSSLQRACRRLKPLFAPARERKAWADLLAGLPAPRSTVKKRESKRRSK